MKQLSYTNNELRNSAISNGLCAQWQAEWKNDWDYEKMISQFYRGIDFYLKTRFVSNEFIKENFDKTLLQKNGVIVDDTYSLLNPEHAILIGDSTSVIRLNGANSSEIYLIDNAKARIYAKGRSFVIVHALGNTNIAALQSGEARLVVIKHSHNVTISPDTNAVIKEEYDYLKNKEGN